MQAPVARISRYPEPPAPMTLPRLRPILARGIYYEMFCGHRVYFAIRSDGKRLNRIGVPIGGDTEADIICRLVAALDVSDPLPLSAQAVRRPARSRPRGRSVAALAACGLRLIAPGRQLSPQR